MDLTFDDFVLNISRLIFAFFYGSISQQKILAPVFYYSA